MGISIRESQLNFIQIPIEEGKKLIKSQFYFPLIKTFKGLQIINSHLSNQLLEKEGEIQKERNENSNLLKLLDTENDFGNLYFDEFTKEIYGKVNINKATKRIPDNIPVVKENYKQY